MDLKIVFIITALAVSLYRMEVNSDDDDYAVVVCKSFNFSRRVLYEIVTTVNVVDKWIDWMPLFMEADHKPLGVGKKFKAFYHANPTTTLFTVTDFDEGNYLVVEANILFSPRIELHFFDKTTQDSLQPQHFDNRTKLDPKSDRGCASRCQSNKSELGVRMTFKSSSAIFQTSARIALIYDYQKSIVFINKRALANEYNLSDKWQTLGDPLRRHQIYSAFFDGRPEVIGAYQFPQGEIPYGSVRVFAILERMLRSEIYCNFFQEKEDQGIKVLALEAEAINEHNNLPFAAFSIVCPISNDKTNRVIELPKYVVLSYDNDPMTLTNPVFVPIRYSGETPYNQEPYGGLAVCTGPIHNNYAQALRIVEFVNTYQLLGAEKIYFYNLNATEAVNKVLNYFQYTYLVEVLDWNLYGYTFEVDMRYSGIFAALNECVYRATFVDNFKYVAIVDLDEILVPLSNLSLLDYLYTVDNSNIHSFEFRSVFFHAKSNPPTDSSHFTTVKNPFLYSQARIIRTSDPLPNHLRSKYVAKARAVIEMGNHFIWRALPGTSAKDIDIDEGLLFHYRDECVAATCSLKEKKDFTMRRYETDLRKQVDETCKEVFESGICPIG